MDKSKDKDKDLPPQGAFGSPRDRQSGELDAAGSTSNEGTVGVASARAPTDQAATAELDPMEVVTCTLGKSPSTQMEKTSTQTTREKRKASSSPGSEIEGMVGKVMHRPTKARIIASTESPEIQETGR